MNLNPEVNPGDKNNAKVKHSKANGNLDNSKYQLHEIECPWSAYVVTQEMTWNWEMPEANLETSAGQAGEWHVLIILHCIKQKLYKFIWIRDILLENIKSNAVG